MTVVEVIEERWEPEWEMGAPTGTRCCGLHCVFDQATWTLLNPIDGGDPLHYCDKCKNEEF